jgi:gliding motility-associated-like protein
VKSDFSFEREVCDPFTISFLTNVKGYNSIKWDLGNGTVVSGIMNPAKKFSGIGNIEISLILDFGFCIDTVKKYISLDIPIDQDIIYNRDTVICEGSSFTINSSSHSDFCWLPKTYLNNSSSSNPTSNPKEDITYTLISKITGSNLIQNANFSFGNQFFTSEYVYSPDGGSTEGVYSVGNNITSWHSLLQPCLDHTSGNGNMLLLNGATSENVNIWKQTVTVLPNTDYQFSTWLQSLYPVNPARLQFAINGINLGNIFEANSSTCIWTNFYTIWNSGNNTTATISIVNKNTIASGNDFAIDDIFFGTVIVKKDSVRIVIKKKLNPSVTPSQEICLGQSVQLYAAGGDIYEWLPKESLNNNKLSNPIAKPNTTTTYAVKITDSICRLDTSLSTSIYLKPFKTLIKSDTTVCELQTVQLFSSGGNIYQWLPDPSLNSLIISSPYATPTKTTKYFLIIKDTICNYSDTLSTIINVLPLPIIKAFKSNDIYCDLRESQLTSTGGSKYSWAPKNSLINSESANAIAKPSKTTKYFVIGENSSGCINKDSITVNVLTESNREFYVPNAFTPNNDGKNDCFGVKGNLNIKVLDFRIFNRWGELIFFTSNASQCWDGKYKGLMQDSGTYIYMIKAKTTCVESISKTGTFVLIR